VVSLIFVVMRIVPGDAASLMLSETGGTPADITRIRTQLGLERPLYEQYGLWLWSVAQGDLGNSYWTGRPVVAELVSRLPVSFELTLLAAIIACLIGIPTGVLSAIRQDSFLDYAGRLVAISGLAVPGFWLGTLLVIFPALWFGWAPPLSYADFFADPLANLQQFLLPSFALGAFMAASMTRMTRSAVLEVLRQDYIRTAWAKGLKEQAIVVRHTLKNALIPLVTFSAIQIGHILGGTVVMETIFSLPGVGRLTIQSILERDFPQLQANVIFLACIFVTVNLVVDLLYGWLDPRISYR